MSQATPARKAALAVLVEAARRDAYAREVLARSQRVRALDARDAAFCQRLVLGVTASSGCLDELLDQHLARPRKVSPRVRTALRLAAFELLYLGTAPEVAVSQGVELVRSQARAAAGLANAVLHRVAKAREGYLDAADVEPGSRELAARARRAGLPVWLAGEIESSLGAAAAGELFAAELEPAPIAAHFLDRGSAPVEDVPALIASGALARGEAVISDLNAQAVALAAVRAGSCLEIGAGRGTKTFVMAAEARRRGLAREHVALDLYEGKCSQNRERLERAGLAAGVRFVAGDATGLDRALAELDAEAGERRLFDTVLLDAPCSGTGTMRRHPEIPWRLTRDEVRHALLGLQLELLEQAAGRVAPGGRLVYATCSVLAAENAGVTGAFLASPAGAAFAEHSRTQTHPAPGAFDGHFHVVFDRIA